GLTHLFQQKLHGFYCGKWIQNLPQDPDSVQFILRNKQLFLARTRAIDIDRRKDSLVDELAVQADFHVARTLELFEDHVIHAASRINQRRSDDSQTAALFDVARRAEETFRTLQGVGVYTAGQHFARWRHDRVVRPRQTRNGVEENDNVSLMF